MNQTKPYTIGLDLGGTNSEFGIVDHEGNIIASSTMKTGGYATADDYVDAAIKCLMPIIEQVGGLDKIEYMGAGAPNGNYLNGCIEFAPNLPWAHDSKVPLAKMFSDRLGGLPVHLTNDANAAALGEMTYGVARGMKNFIVITLGTGVGSGIVINGEMVYGCDGMAGELGHFIVRRENGRQCGCGRKGCLETYCSATGVARTAKEIVSSTDRPTLLREIELDKITSLDVSIAASKGDEVAKKVVDKYIGYLACGISNIVNIFQPEILAVGGGIGNEKENLLEPVRRVLASERYSIHAKKQTRLMAAELGNDAGIIGAALLDE